MAQKPETNFRTNQVIPFLKTLKNTAYFPIQQVAIRGDADFVLCCRGDFIWLELKSLEGQIRPLQEYKGMQVRAAGGITLVASPDNWRRTKHKLHLLDEGAYER